MKVIKVSGKIYVTRFERIVPLKQGMDLSLGNKLDFSKDLKSSLKLDLGGVQINIRHEQVGDVARSLNEILIGFIH